MAAARLGGDSFLGSSLTARLLHGEQGGCGKGQEGQGWVQGVCRVASATVIFSLSSNGSNAKRRRWPLRAEEAELGGAALPLKRRNLHALQWFCWKGDQPCRRRAPPRPTSLGGHPGLRAALPFQSSGGKEKVAEPPDPSAKDGQDPGHFAVTLAEGGSRGKAERWGVRRQAQGRRDPPHRGPLCPPNRWAPSKRSRWGVGIPGGARIHWAGAWVLLGPWNQVPRQPRPQSRALLRCEPSNTAVPSSSRTVPSSWAQRCADTCTPARSCVSVGSHTARPHAQGEDVPATAPGRRVYPEDRGGGTAEGEASGRDGDIFLPRGRSRPQTGAALQLFVAPAAASDSGGRQRGHCFSGACTAAAGAARTPC